MPPMTRDVHARFTAVEYAELEHFATRLQIPVSVLVRAIVHGALAEARERGRLIVRPSQIEVSV